MRLTPYIYKLLFFFYRAEALKRIQEGNKPQSTSRTLPVTKDFASINLDDSPKPQSQPASKGKKYTSQELAVLK